MSMIVKRADTEGECGKGMGVGVVVGVWEWGTDACPILTPTVLPLSGTAPTGPTNQVHDRRVM